MVVRDALAGLLMPTVDGLGYELLGVERQTFAGGTLVRLYIDSDDGVGVEDCATVSRQVSDVLDVEQAIAGDYTLEVSSPGLDRTLSREKDFAAACGKQVKVETRAPIGGRRRFRGELASFVNDVAEASVDGEIVSIPFADVSKARVLYEFTREDFSASR